MDNTTARKRMGRPPKAKKTSPSLLQGTDANPMDVNKDPSLPKLNQQATLEEKSDVDGSVSLGSHIPDGQPQYPTANSECRRSSRKKIVKFDVRDLLNKNRKSHKIQIEARIDSNEPNPTKHRGNLATGTEVNSNVTTTDLTSKQKTFIEKSAIFRRFSISEQQNKVATPLRPLPLPKIALLNKGVGSDCDISPMMDATKIAQARRMSRTHEIFNASMMKSKQNSSLIVAQMESNNTASCSTLGAPNTPPVTQRKVTPLKKKNSPKLSNLHSVPISNAQTESASTNTAPAPLVVQKRRGRPPKNKTAWNAVNVFKSLGGGCVGDVVSERNIEQNNVNQSEMINSINISPQTDIKLDNQYITQPNIEQHSLIPEKAKNWKEYKACLKEIQSSLGAQTAFTSDNIEIKIENESDSLKSSSNKTLQENIILEISSSSSESNQELCTYKSGTGINLPDKHSGNCGIELNESKQRNFAAVSFLQESPNLDDNITAPEFIVAAVEEIIDVQTIETADDNVIIYNEPKENEIECDIIEIDECKDCNEFGNEVQRKSFENFDASKNLKYLCADQLTIESPSISSESEANNGRGSKCYKPGDTLRVSLKRVCVTDNPVSISSLCTSTDTDMQPIQSTISFKEHIKSLPLKRQSSFMQNQTQAMRDSKVSSDDEKDTYIETKRIIPSIAEETREVQKFSNFEPRTQNISDCCKKENKMIEYSVQQDIQDDAYSQQPDTFITKTEDDLNTTNVDTATEDVGNMNLEKQNISENIASSIMVSWKDINEETQNSKSGDTEVAKLCTTDESEKINKYLNQVKEHALDVDHIEEVEQDVVDKFKDIDPVPQSKIVGYAPSQIECQKAIDTVETTTVEIEEQFSTEYLEQSSNNPEAYVDVNAGTEVVHDCEIETEPIKPKMLEKNNDIVLPPKKQVTKFKQFENYSDNEHEYLDGNVSDQNFKTFLQQNIQSVNVETSTLVDILKTANLKKTNDNNIVDFIDTEESNNDTNTPQRLLSTESNTIINTPNSQLQEDFHQQSLITSPKHSEITLCCEESSQQNIVMQKPFEETIVQRSQSTKEYPDIDSRNKIESGINQDLSPVSHIVSNSETEHLYCTNTENIVLNTPEFEKNNVSGGGELSKEFVDELKIKTSELSKYIDSDKNKIIAKNYTDELKTNEKPNIVEAEIVDIALLDLKYMSDTTTAVEKTEIVKEKMHSVTKTISRRGRKPKYKLIKNQCSTEDEEVVTNKKVANEIQESTKSIRKFKKQKSPKENIKGESSLSNSTSSDDIEIRNHQERALIENKQIGRESLEGEYQDIEKKEFLYTTPLKKRLLTFDPEFLEKSSDPLNKLESRADTPSLLNNIKVIESIESESVNNDMHGMSDHYESNFTNELSEKPVSQEISETIVKSPLATVNIQKRKTKFKIEDISSDESCAKLFDSSNLQFGKSELENKQGSEYISTNKAEQTMDEDCIIGKNDEKSAKKKRQRKLKEAFEAALTDNSKTMYNDKETNYIINANILPTSKDGYVKKELYLHEPPSAISLQNNSEIVERKLLEMSKTHSSSLADAEDDSDPLRDIEKFIEDGVNLLKRDYKIDEDSVDTTTQDSQEKMCGKHVPTEERLNTNEMNNDCIIKTDNIMYDITVQSDRNDLEKHLSSFDTPAYTPISTPTITSPPKSPLWDPTSDESLGVRRSHRIKQITKAPKALVGRGLVRDKERFSIKDDMETKSHYSLDDHLMDLAEVEAKNAKFLKEMEERLSNFHVIKENEYKCERIISKEARKMICDCFLTAEEEERGELACGEDCLNRLLMIECGPDCNVKDRCTNKRFQKFLCSPCRVFRTERKGFGIMADIEILPGEFIMEYVGEVIDGDEFENRRNLYSLDKNRHYYFMALRSDAIIDATIKGNISRFINHSCDPNAETQKWTVNGELRIGFFSRKSIMPGEEITFDYQYQRYGREAQRCYCDSSNCRGWIGEEPNSDEGEQLDEDSDDDNLAARILKDVEAEEDSDDESKDKLNNFNNNEKLIQNSLHADGKLGSSDISKNKTDEDLKEIEEDAKTKFKKLLCKMAEKEAKKKELKKKEKKEQKRLAKSANEMVSSKQRYLEDPDIDDEVRFLSRCGVKNQSDTLRLSRLMVRAKLVQTRLNLLDILCKGELPCRRLFLDYHGLRLLHGWMSEDEGEINLRMALLQTLESLPIVNKTMLTDTKVYQTVRKWSGNESLTPNSLSPSDESSKESSGSNSQQAVTSEDHHSDLQKLASRLTSTWDNLPEIFRIPKRERIEQMKEHEREADRQYAAATDDDLRALTNDSYQRDRFGRTLATRFGKPHGIKEIRSISVLGAGTSNEPRKRSTLEIGIPTQLSKEQRREMFAAKVARDEAEKRFAEERREHETRARFFGVDPKRTRPMDMPFFVNSDTWQWYSISLQPIPPPPIYANVVMPEKVQSTNPADYELPDEVYRLPHNWRYAISPLGYLYYYHLEKRLTQWELPTEDQADDTDSDSDKNTIDSDSSGEDVENLLDLDQMELNAYVKKLVEKRRHKRYNNLVDERPISPRHEEDRIYNQNEMRKYRENKEKIRKRKEELRRRRAEALKNTPENPASENSVANDNLQLNDSNEESQGSETIGALPIQDYLLSSDEEDLIKEEPLLDRIVQCDNIEDEVDGLAKKRGLKRAIDMAEDELNPQPEINPELDSNILEKPESKKRRLEKREKSSKKNKDAEWKYRKLREKFRCDIAGIIVHHLKPYRKDTCTQGRIKSNEDFNHLARKLTHFVMIKELKYCLSVGQTLDVTESVKNKSRDFIRKYMGKYDDVYIKPKHDPAYKEIPFTL